MLITFLSQLSSNELRPEPWDWPQGFLPRTTLLHMLFQICRTASVVLWLERWTMARVERPRFKFTTLPWRSLGLSIFKLQNWDYPVCTCCHSPTSSSDLAIFPSLQPFPIFHSKLLWCSPLLIPPSAPLDHVPSWLPSSLQLSPLHYIINFSLFSAPFLLLWTMPQPQLVSKNILDSSSSPTISVLPFTSKLLEHAADFLSSNSSLDPEKLASAPRSPITSLFAKPKGLGPHIPWPFGLPLTLITLFSWIIHDLAFSGSNLTWFASYLYNHLFKQSFPPVHLCPTSVCSWAPDFLLLYLSL